MFDREAITRATYCYLKKIVMYSQVKFESKKYTLKFFHPFRRTQRLES